MWYGSCGTENRHSAGERWHGLISQLSAFLKDLSLRYHTAQVYVLYEAGALAALPHDKHMSPYQHHRNPVTN